jgi:hypothetical protein
MHVMHSINQRREIARATQNLPFKKNNTIIVIIIIVIIIIIIIISPLQSAAGHRPLQSLAISLDPRLLGSSSCQPSCANHHSIWPEGVLNYVYGDAVSTPELVYPSGFRFYGWYAIIVISRLIPPQLEHRPSYMNTWTGRNTPREFRVDWWLLMQPRPTK